MRTCDQEDVRGQSESERGQSCACKSAAVAAHCLRLLPVKCEPMDRGRSDQQRASGDDEHEACRRGPTIERRLQREPLLKQRIELEAEQQLRAKHLHAQLIQRDLQQALIVGHACATPNGLVTESRSKMGDDVRSHSLVTVTSRGYWLDGLASTRRGSRLTPGRRIS